MSDSLTAFDENIVCPITGEVLVLDVDELRTAEGDNRYQTSEDILHLFVDPERSSSKGSDNVTEDVQEFYTDAPFPNYNDFDNIGVFLRRANDGVFGGPEAVLAYLSRYTHRVAIANSRLVAVNGMGVSFKWKDYREGKANDGRARYKTMTLAVHEFCRRFLIHVLPSGFHRIRHDGLFANGSRARNLALARERLAMPAPEIGTDDAECDDDTGPPALPQPCPQCGGRMLIIERLEAGQPPRAPPPRSRSHTP